MDPRGFADGLQESGAEGVLAVVSLGPPLKDYGRGRLIDWVREGSQIDEVVRVTTTQGTQGVMLRSIVDIALVTR